MSNEKKWKVNHKIHTMRSWRKFCEVPSFPMDSINDTTNLKPVSISSYIGIGRYAGSYPYTLHFKVNFCNFGTVAQMPLGGTQFLSKSRVQVITLQDSNCLIRRTVGGSPVSHVEDPVEFPDQVLNSQVQHPTIALASLCSKLTNRVILPTSH